MTIDFLRKLIEFAYLFAWGPQGSTEKSNEFNQSLKRIEPLVGTFTYDGNNSFLWEIEEDKGLVGSQFGKDAWLF